MDRQTLGWNVSFLKCLSELCPRKTKINLGRQMYGLAKEPVVLGVWYWDFLEVRGEAHQHLVFKSKDSPGTRAMLFTFSLVSSEWGCRTADSSSGMNVLSTLLSIWYTRHMNYRFHPQWSSDSPLNTCSDRSEHIRFRTSAGVSQSGGRWRAVKKWMRDD